jgi:hypothetical protein
LVGANKPTVLSTSDKSLFLSCSYENRLTPYIATTDLFILENPHNDYVLGNTMGETDADFISIPTDSRNRNTGIGAINTMIDLILKGNPRARICFIGHYENKLRAPISLGQITLANYWNFPLLKLWDKLGWSQQLLTNNAYWSSDFLTYNKTGGPTVTWTILANWLGDGLHPHSTATKEYIAGNIVPFLKELK